MKTRVECSWQGGLQGWWLVALAAMLSGGTAHAQGFDWKRHQGKTVTFLANNNPLVTALLKYKPEFEQLTGITLKVDIYQEQQMRQRLVTVMNSRSDEIDVFMSLPSRELHQFAKAGWYADLSPYVKRDVASNYDWADFSPVLVKDATQNGKLFGVPLNIEGPVLYYRKDLLRKCAVALPKSLSDMESTAAKLKACEPSVVPFVTRGLKSAAPYTYSVFLHNFGGQYMRDGHSQLCSKAGRDSLELYARLLKNYGPPGAVNYNFYQISALYKEGRAAMAFESSNELRSMMEGGAREKDTAVAVLPPGPAGSQPTVIGWTMNISSASANKDAAWYFLQWASSSTVQEKLALNGIAPARMSVAEDKDYKAWAAEQSVRRDWVAALGELARAGTSEVAYPIVANPASREFIGQAISDVLLGKKNAAQACADADAGLNDLIAKD